MNIAIILASIVTIIFAALGLTNILPDDIANPVMIVAMATLLLLRGVEHKNRGAKVLFILNSVTAIIAYVFVLYSVFLG